MQDQTLKTTKRFVFSGSRTLAVVCFLFNQNAREQHQVNLGTGVPSLFEFVVLR